LGQELIQGKTAKTPGYCCKCVYLRMNLGGVYGKKENTENYNHNTRPQGCAYLYRQSQSLRGKTD
jgi:hypothetical protein